MLANLKVAMTHGGTPMTPGPRPDASRLKFRPKLKSGGVGPRPSTRLSREGHRQGAIQKGQSKTSKTCVGASHV
jgi:hypothetical protein